MRRSHTESVIARFCLRALTLFSLSLAVPLQAAEADRQPQEELESVAQAIDAIAQWLLEAQGNYTAQEQALRDAELAIAATGERINAIESEQRATEAKRLALQQDMAALEADKNTQLQALQAVLRAAYMQSDRNLLQRLLDQEASGSSARMLHYYRAFSQSQLDTIARFQDTLDTIAQTRDDLQQAEETLARQRVALEQQRNTLASEKQSRERALAALADDIVARNAELEQLQIDQAQLQQLVAEINRVVERLPAPERTTSFSAQQGQLVMPVAGTIMSPFGARYGDGNLRRNGITINASTGTPVRAAHGGRVVFADWLRGTGLLVVLDHGDGYMSLYGNNEALAVQPGAWVNAGDTVALSGSSGTSQEAGLYFEIRHHGTPLDPGQWLPR